MIAFGLLNFRRCCSLRLDGKIQDGFIPIHVSLDGRIMPCRTIVARPPTFACASRQATCCAPCRIALIIVCPQRCAYL
jgi:hypothetical protein